MSFEGNGSAPVVTKRKKHKDKAAPSKKPGDFNIPGYLNYNNGANGVPNSIPEHPYYFPFYQQHHLATEPMSLPVYSFAYQSPMSYHNAPGVPPSYIGAKGNSLQTAANNNDANDYMSLPVNVLEHDDCSDKRRFSDPGVPFDSDSSSNSLDGRVLQKITQQVNAMKEAIRKLNKETVDLRMELNMVKQQQSMRHFDREYEPGMLAEVIREIRDAARVREDALLAKVKHMIEEKQFNMSQLHFANDKNRNSDRLCKLEEQMKSLNVSNNRSDDNVSLPCSSALDDGQNSARQVIELEREVLNLRRELEDARAKREESDHKSIHYC